MSDPRVERLTAAARKKGAEKTKAAESAIRKLRKADQPVNFLTVAREAGVSHSFLYSHDELRRRIEHLRQSRASRQQPTSEPSGAEDNVVTVLTRQLELLKGRHREEVQALKDALERALGENIVLRRQLSQHGITPVVGSPLPQDMGKP